MKFATALPSILSLVSLSLCLLLVATTTTSVHGVPAPSISTRRLATKKPKPSPTKPSAIPVLSPVGQKIAKYAPGAYNAFVPGSLQKKALTYVESVPNASNLTDAKAVQLYALGCFYYGTYAVNNQVWQSSFPALAPLGWKISKNWVNPLVDPCSGNGKKVWTGVTCANKKITRIELPSNRLIGSVPIEVALLASNNPSGAGAINYIDLYDNQFLLNIGDTGNAWISRLGPAMQYLFLGSTSLVTTTGVPDAVGALIGLIELDVSYTLISGPLRSIVFAPLTKLQYLELDGNAYNSSIPSVIGTLPKLKFLYVINAFVSGDLSFTVGMKNIEELWVDQNSISGKLPTTLGNSTAMRSFSVSRNKLAGAIPTTLKNWVNLEQAWFYTNKFTGQFPSVFNAIPKLTLIRLENNLIKGGNAATLCKNSVPKGGLLATIGTDCPSKVKCTSCAICCCSVANCTDSP